MSVSINVTNHARERWHQRAAVHGNEPVAILIAAVRESTTLDPNQVPVKFIHHDCEYLFHAPSNGIFVVQCCKQWRIKVVTYYEVPTVGKPVVDHTFRLLPDGIEFLDDQPTFPDLDAEALWLSRQWSLVQSALSSTTKDRRPLDPEHETALNAYQGRLKIWRSDRKKRKNDARKAAKFLEKMTESVNKPAF